MIYDKAAACPALVVLHGAGKDPDGRFMFPGHRYRDADGNRLDRCGHCGRTKR